MVHILSWPARFIAEKLLGSKKPSRLCNSHLAEGEKKLAWTRWHSACMLIATLLGGIDLVVGAGSKLFIVKKASDRERDLDQASPFAENVLASESDANSAYVVTFPGVFKGQDIGKDVSQWSESQAMSVAKIVWLENHAFNTSYGLGQFTLGRYPARGCLAVDPKLPKMSSEEELMVRTTIAFGEADAENGEA